MGATGSGVFTCAEAVEQPVPRLTGDAAVRALTVDALLTRTLEEVHTLIHIWRGGGESGGGGERRRREEVCATLQRILWVILIGLFIRV